VVGVVGVVGVDVDVDDSEDPEDSSDDSALPTAAVVEPGARSVLPPHAERTAQTATNPSLVWAFMIGAISMRSANAQVIGITQPPRCARVPAWAATQSVAAHVRASARSAIREG
jgi:hypothetical protein